LQGRSEQFLVGSVTAVGCLRLMTTILGVNLTLVKKSAGEGLLWGQWAEALDQFSVRVW
jgi:hypothetical protein